MAGANVGGIAPQTESKSTIMPTMRQNANRNLIGIYQKNVPANMVAVSCRVRYLFSSQL
jgi:hypothetical protein